MHWNLIVVKLILLNMASIMCQSTEIKKTRRPNRLDHMLCKQKYSGFGIRSSAILNYSGELCKTYCKIINRRNRTASFTENISPNNIRCGPLGARCVEGLCSSGGSNSAPITEDASNGRKGRPLNSNRRPRPQRKGSSTTQKITSISTIEMTDFGETETMTTNPDVIINESEDTDSTNINNENKQKIIFPND